MKIVFMGTPLFAQVILKALIQKHEVIAVITQPDQLVGRKKTITPSPVKRFALENNIPVFQPINLSQAYETILALDADIYITAAYGQFVPSVMLKHKPSINVHGSLLPSYRGGAPIQYAIKDGLVETGVTIMHMVKRMDAGNIISQHVLPISPEDTYTTLSQKMSELGAKALLEVLDTYGTQLPEGRLQDESKVSFAYTLKREDERLSLQDTVQAFLNKMKSLLEEPVGHINVNGQPIKVYDAKKSDIIKTAAMGTVIRCHKQLTIQLIDGALDILVLQAPGKKKLNIKDFLNGQKIFTEGMTIKE
ncbi:MAG: methionyl-tRNA formyltransferase [Acholeplasmataceae bacterium]